MYINMEELIRLTKENNIVLNKILNKIIEAEVKDDTLQRLCTNFGVGILSNIVGDRILGLGK